MSTWWYCNIPLKFATTVSNEIVGQISCSSVWLWVFQRQTRTWWQGETRHPLLLGCQQMHPITNLEFRGIKSLIKHQKGHSCLLYLLKIFKSIVDFENISTYLHPKFMWIKEKKKKLPKNILIISEALKKIVFFIHLFYSHALYHSIFLVFKWLKSFD